MDEKTLSYHREWRAKHPGYAPNQDESIIRACTKCKVPFPATDKYFGTEKTRPLGIGSHCKRCLSLSRAAYNKRHRKEINTRQRAWRKGRERKYTLRKKGVTPKWYAETLEKQGGVCFICQQPPVKGNLCVDHNHRTLEPRGLLCIKCNNTLERLETIPDWYNRAMLYLSKEN